MNTSKKREQRQEEMFELMTEQENSGLSQVAYCQQQKMSIATFSYWRKKYLDRQHLATTMPADLKKEKFIPLQIQPNRPTSIAALEIELPNQIIIRCTAWQLEQLPEVVRQLQKVNH